MIDFPNPNPKVKKAEQELAKARHLYERAAERVEVHAMAIGRAPDMDQRKYLSLLIQERASAYNGYLVALLKFQTSLPTYSLYVVD